MACRALPWLVLPTLLVVACSRPQQEAAPSAAPAGVGAGAAATGAEAPAVPVVAAPAETAAAAPAAAGAVIASQETNWPGIVVEVLGMKRKGNTLTATVRLRNGGAEKQQAEVKYEDVYLLDTANAKKYQVLRDEKGTYVAALHSGWGDRWYDEIQPTKGAVLWIKFPAPPPEVTAITLQLPSTPPFEDLAIQDG
jgi:hypothetical protein